MLIITKTPPTNWLRKNLVFYQKKTCSYKRNKSCYFFSYFLDEFWVFFSQDFSQKSHKTICMSISLASKSLVSINKQISCPYPYGNLKPVSNKIQLLYYNTTLVFERFKLICTINPSSLICLTN